MPDASLDLRTEIALGERVAVVETKLNGLKEDTSVMRNAIHGIHGEMQKYAIQEERCVAALTQIASQTAGLPGFIAEFNERKPLIDALVAKDTKKQGAWASWVMTGSIVIALVTVAAAIFTAVGTWLTELHKVGQ